MQAESTHTFGDQMAVLRLMSVAELYEAGDVADYPGFLPQISVEFAYFGNGFVNP
jgi:hypothetical protein